MQQCAESAHSDLRAQSDQLPHTGDAAVFQAHDYRAGGRCQSSPAHGQIDSAGHDAEQTLHAPVWHRRRRRLLDLMPLLRRTDPGEREQQRRIVIVGLAHSVEAKTAMPQRFQRGQAVLRAGIDITEIAARCAFGEGAAEPGAVGRIVTLAGSAIPRGHRTDIEPIRYLMRCVQALLADGFSIREAELAFGPVAGCTARDADQLGDL
ncbi:hypothetical protein [Nocardia cyriacigeorgica]|uniref:hypothetical protein n=1 Tax=Nocardia cyriacigeorgica TaxID=135487 RepID=UPI0021152BF2|nr:hypothetical protein [Nocardia cyriacigeorgica]